MTKNEFVKTANILSDMAEKVIALMPGQKVKIICDESGYEVWVGKHYLEHKYNTIGSFDDEEAFCVEE